MWSRVCIILLFECICRATLSPRQNNCDISENFRFDCFPENGATEQACHNRGCCWSDTLENLGEPVCFYGTAKIGYKVCGQEETITGFILELCFTGFGGHYGNNILKLSADFRLESDDTLHIKVIVNYVYQVYSK